MQNKCVLKDRCIPLFTLFIFLLTMYSAFGNTKDSPDYFDLYVFQQPIKGVVTDSNGVPIPGVNVQVEGVDAGTFTNDNGVFYLQAKPGDILILSYIGFKTLKLKVGESKELTLILQENVTALESVTVNAGYYTVKERESTGSIEKVTSEEIELQPIVSPLEALQGRMAGVEVVQQSGIPGSAPTIRIRGRNSLREEGNFPLYIIDGMPINSSPIQGGSNAYNIGAIGGMDPLSTLNLANIESIEVLKDADATAIYGSRGANGVVLITTKKGKFNKKTEIETRIYSGIGEVSNKVSLINTEEYLALRNAALENDGREPTETSDYDLLLWDRNRYTDWQDVLFGGTSPITDLNIFATGGNGTTAFRLGGSYHKEGSVFPGNNDYHKLTAGIRLTHVSENKKLNIDFSANYGIDKSNIYSNGGSNFITNALSLPPNAPALYNEDGSLHWKDWEYSSWANPLAIMKHRNTSDKGRNIVANLGLSYELFRGAKIKTNIGYTNLTREFKGLFSKNQYSPEDRNFTEHESVESHRDRESLIIEPQFIYQTKIGKGKLDGLLGMTFQQSTSKGLRVKGVGFVSEDLMADLSAAQSTEINNNQIKEYKYNAIFGRLGYNWNRKYFINLTGRRDGSSRFGSNKRFSNFWAIGGAWIFTEEPFINKNLPFLSFGKLRVSYGITGNDQIGDYGYMDSYEPTRGPNGLYPTQLTNPGYSWEINKKLETALEIGLWQDRINFNVSRYQNRSSNQLVGYQLPSITGFSSIIANFPATVQNKGWEFGLSVVNLKSKKYNWQTTFNISFPENELLEYPNIEQSSYANKYRVGYPLDIQFLYQMTGVDSETGTYQFVDANEDDRLDVYDRVLLKNTGRKYYGGISNRFSYLGFSFNFLVEFVKQDGYNLFNGLPGSKTIQTTDYFNSWNYGHNSKVQTVSESFDALLSYYNSLQSELYFSDASYIRLKTIGLSYNLPNSILQKMGISSCKVFLQGQNLLTISNYQGLNVEFPGGNSIPALRSITMGVQFKI